jgi:LacI family transcriptional regulator
VQPWHTFIRLFNKGKPMTTIHDVAKQAGVSSMTVSRVLNGSKHISPSTRERVERAISELGYVPNDLARSLRRKRSRTLALILSDITNPFFTAIARGVEDAANDSDFSVVFCNTDESNDKELRYVNNILQRQIDGTLLIPASDSQETLELFLQHKQTVVLIDRRIEHNTLFDCVLGDSYNGAYELVQHLLTLGHRRIAFLGGPESVSTSQDRLAGYQHALTNAGIAIRAEYICFDQYTQGAGYDNTQQFLQLAAPPTAIFAANNFLAFGAMAAIKEAHLQVPQDLSLVLFDDLPDQMNYEPFFTAATQPAYEIGQQAARLLLARIEGDQSEPQEIILPTSLVIRNSSARPPL